MLGEGAGRIVFSAGVLGASLVAAIVSSLALAWGVGEVAGYRRSLEYRPFDAGWFYGVYAACVLGSGAAVWFASNLVWLNIAAQVFNAFLMPLVIGLLVALAVVSLARTVSAARLVSRTARRCLHDRLGGRRFRRRAGADVRRANSGRGGFGRSTLKATVSAVRAVPSAAFGR